MKSTTLSRLYLCRRFSGAGVQQTTPVADDVLRSAGFPVSVLPGGNRLAADCRLKLDKDGRVIGFGFGVADEVLRAAGFSPRQQGGTDPEPSLAEAAPNRRPPGFPDSGAQARPSTLGQGDIGTTTGADKPVGAIAHVDGIQGDTLIPNIEARVTGEVLRLMGAVKEFGLGLQLIRKEIPPNAYFSQSITLFLALSSLNLSNALGLSVMRGIFRDGGREYITQLEMDVKHLFREINLDGRRFLAVALVDEGTSQVFDGRSTVNSK